MLAVLLVTVSDDSLQSQCLCGFSYNDIITTTYAVVLAGVLACAHVPVCVYVIGSLPASLWLAGVPGWQGLAGLLGRWDRVVGTADDLAGGGVG